jgi:integrase
LYLFRHSWITRKLVAGVDSTVLKDLAGHSDAQMISRVYGHAAEDYKFMLEQARRDVSDNSARPERRP